MLVTYYAHRAVNLDQHDLHFMRYMHETGNKYPPENRREKPLVQFYFDWCEGDARGQWPEWSLGFEAPQDISVPTTEEEAADADGATAVEVLDALNVRLRLLRSRRTIPGMGILTRVLLRQGYQEAVDSLTDALAPARPGDVVYLGDERLTHVDRAVSLDTIIDEQGEEIRVERDTERDRLLRAAVHDDGQRRAWQIAKQYR